MPQAETAGTAPVRVTEREMEDVIFNFSGYAPQVGFEKKEREFLG